MIGAHINQKGDFTHRKLGRILNQARNVRTPPNIGQYKYKIVAQQQRDQCQNFNLDHIFVIEPLIAAKSVKRGSEMVWSCLGHNIMNLSKNPEKPVGLTLLWSSVIHCWT